MNDAPTADLERKLGLDESSASALPLLDASLSLLDPGHEHQEAYAEFAESVDADIRKWLSIRKVIEFWRTAINMPPWRQS